MEILSSANREGETASLPDEGVLYNKVTWRLLPLLFVCYVVAYLDRVNVGFAKLQMAHDLGFSDEIYGLGAGIFFVGYCCSEIPSNLLLAHFGARRWLSRIMITWGVVSACMLFVKTPAAFYGLRCVLGIAEAGMFPGVIYYLTFWYPAHRRGRILALFMAAQPVSGVIGGPLSGWIMQALQGTGHLAGWQWLFLLEALPAVVLGVGLLYWLDDNIEDARWLTRDQKQTLLLAMEVESARKQVYHSFSGVVRNGRVWLLGLITFCSVMGLYGIGFWLPSIIRGMGVERPLHIGLITTIPYAVAVVTMMLVSRSSDRTGERRWHLALATTAGGLGLILSTYFAGNTIFALAGLTVATAGIITSQPLFWNLPTAFLGGSGAAGAIALINAGGNSAGFVSPYLVGWFARLTHSLDAGIYMLAFFLLLGSALTLCVPPALVNGRSGEPARPS